MVEQIYPLIDGSLQTAQDHEKLELFMGECYGGNSACRTLEAIFNAFLRERGRDQRIADASTGAATLLVQSIPDYFQTCRRELRKYLRRTPLGGKDLFRQTVIASILTYRKNILSTVVQPQSPYPAKDIALAYVDPEISAPLFIH